MSESAAQRNLQLPSKPKLEKCSKNLSAGSEDPEIENNKENIRPAQPQQALASRVKPSSCVFVASLRSNRADDDLCRSVTSHFSRFGKLVSVKVLRDLANRPYAFVQYTNDEDCKIAIELGHNAVLDGRRLRCEAAKVNRTLFISRARPMKLTEVEQKLSEYGETELIIASTENGNLISEPLPASAKCLNWFVKFCYRDDAIGAFASMTNSADFHVEWAQNIDDSTAGVPRIDKFSIFVGQLSGDVTEKDLRDRFTTHGEIEYISIKAKPGSSFAFITFKHEKSAAGAVAVENHSMFMSKTILVQYKEVTSKAASKMILSPRTPIALAPPPINIRRGLVNNENSSKESRPYYNYENMSGNYGSCYKLQHNTYRVPYYKYERQKKVLSPRDSNSWAPYCSPSGEYYGKRLNDINSGNGGRSGPFYIAPNYGPQR